MTCEIASGKALHDGVIHGPDGRPDDGHPEHLLLGEDHRKGDPVGQGLQQGGYISPGLMIDGDDIPLFPAQVGGLTDVPGNLQKTVLDEKDAPDPALHQSDQTAGAGRFPGGRRQAQFDQRQQMDREPPDQRIDGNDERDAAGSQMRRKGGRH